MRLRLVGSDALEGWILAFRDESGDDAEGPPLYLALADFARPLIGKLERGDRVR
jgi:hypothetical protein